MKKRTSSRQNPKPAVKAKRVRQSVTIGMDLGDRNSRYCLLSNEGEILREGEVATTKAGMTGTFGRIGRARIAIEVGTHSPGDAVVIMGEEVTHPNWDAPYAGEIQHRRFTDVWKQFNGVWNFGFAKQRSQESNNAANCRAPTAVQASDADTADRRESRLVSCTPGSAFNLTHPAHRRPPVW
jgi:hypothetical protein